MECTNLSFKVLYCWSWHLV